MANIHPVGWVVRKGQMTGRAKALVLSKPDKIKRIEKLDFRYKGWRSDPEPRKAREISVLKGPMHIG
jgi:hypothetical protein